MDTLSLGIDFGHGQAHIPRIPTCIFTTSFPGTHSTGTNNSQAAFLASTSYEQSDIRDLGRKAIISQYRYGGKTSLVIHLLTPLSLTGPETGYS